MELVIKRFIIANDIIKDDLLSILDLMNLVYQIDNGKDLVIRMNKDDLLNTLFGLINEMARFNFTLRLMYFVNDKQRMICELEA